MKGRSALLAAALAVGLWIAGLAISHGNSHLASKATDDQTLAWVKHHSGTIIVSSWIFALGSLVFMWFLALVRGRLAEAEGGSQTLSSLVFGAGVAAAAFSIAVNGDIGSAINKNDVSPATAAALHGVGDLFFLVAELALAVAMVSFAVLVLRTQVLPKWWAYLSLLVGFVLLIGPIGWAALIFGTPVWALGTGFMLGRTGGEAPAAAAVPA